MSPAITDLADLVAGLPPAARENFERIFDVEVVRGELVPPQPMLPWIERQFGSVESVIGQDIVKVTNRLTLEGTVYNTLRALRPHHFRSQQAGAADLYDGQDPFAKPLLSTTADPFGRVEGKYCVTAGNVAKCDGHHGVIIFNEFDPLSFGREQVHDYLETGWRWAQRAHQYDPQARHYLFLWNCSYRAGASLPHGHAQVLLGRERHYAKVEMLRLAADNYGSLYERDYFADLYAAHESLGLGWQAGGIKLMVYLAAIKLNEVMLLAPSGGAALADAVYAVLACYRDSLGVKSFNLGIAYPPLDDMGAWEGFPLVARLVDSGDTADLSSDIGAMEFYGANVVSSDPFKISVLLGDALK